MSPRRYAYVGPPDIRDAVLSAPAGTPITSRDELSTWFALYSSDAERDGTMTATFVIMPNGILRLAPRRSEHVACASGGPVLSAGEMTFSNDLDVTEISNLSTGFCPEPESWASVAAALDQIPVDYPDDFTVRIVFRLCPKCMERNVVKDGWFVCDVCGADLPADWNFASDSVGG